MDVLHIYQVISNLHHVHLLQVVLKKFLYMPPPPLPPPEDGMASLPAQMLLSGCVPIISTAIVQTGGLRHIAGTRHHPRYCTVSEVPWLSRRRGKADRCKETQHHKELSHSSMAVYPIHFYQVRLGLWGILECHPFTFQRRTRKHSTSSVPNTKHFWVSCTQSRTHLHSNPTTPFPERFWLLWFLQSIFPRTTIKCHDWF